MGRIVTLDDFDNIFKQGSALENIGITLNTLGGNDRIALGRIGPLGGGNTVDAGSGDDSVTSLTERGNTIHLGLGNDSYYGNGMASLITDAIDRVYAGAGKDTLWAKTLHSAYFGEAGNDTFVSAGWQNSFSGGSGRDTISYALRNSDPSREGWAVRVNLAAGYADTWTGERETLKSIENAIGTDQNDELIGTEGGNRLEGAKGMDNLTGNGGADRFVFGKTADELSFDTIQDFSRGEGDKIVLTQIDADKTQDGNQAFHFIGNDFMPAEAGALVFQTYSNVRGVFVLCDTNGDGLEDFRLSVLGEATLRASDFLL